MFFTVRRRPKIDIEEYNFLEKIFAKSKPEERTWAKLVNLNTVHWYCDGPEPTPAVIKYEEHTCQRKFVNLYILLDCLYCKLTHLLFRDARRKKKGSLLEVELAGLSMLIAKPYHLTKLVSFEFKSRCHWINQSEEEHQSLVQKGIEYGSPFNTNDFWDYVSVMDS